MSDDARSAGSTNPSRTSSHRGHRFATLADTPSIAVDGRLEQRVPIFHLLREYLHEASCGGMWAFVLRPLVTICEFIQLLAFALLPYHVWGARNSATLRMLLGYALLPLYDPVSVPLNVDAASKATEALANGAGTDVSGAVADFFYSDPTAARAALVATVAWVPAVTLIAAAIVALTYLLTYSPDAGFVLPVLHRRLIVIVAVACSGPLLIPVVGLHAALLFSAPARLPFGYATGTDLVTGAVQGAVVGRTVSTIVDLADAVESGGRYPVANGSATTPGQSLTRAAIGSAAAAAALSTSSSAGGNTAMCHIALAQALQQRAAVAFAAGAYLTALEANRGSGASPAVSAAFVRAARAVAAAQEARVNYMGEVRRVAMRVRRNQWLPGLLDDARVTPAVAAAMNAALDAAPAWAAAADLYNATYFAAPRLTERDDDDAPLDADNTASVCLNETTPCASDGFAAFELASVTRAMNALVADDAAYGDDDTSGTAAALDAALKTEIAASSVSASTVAAARRVVLYLGAARPPAALWRNLPPYKFDVKTSDTATALRVVAAISLAGFLIVALMWHGCIYEPTSAAAMGATTARSSGGYGVVGALHGIVAAVLFHYFRSEGQLLYFATYFAFANAVLLLLHVLHRPYFAASAHRYRVTLYALCAVASTWSCASYMGSGLGTFGAWSPTVAPAVLFDDAAQGIGEATFYAVHAAVADLVTERVLPAPLAVAYFSSPAAWAPNVTTAGNRSTAFTWAWAVRDGNVTGNVIRGLTSGDFANVSAVEWKAAVDAAARGPVLTPPTHGLDLTKISSAVSTAKGWATLCARDFDLLIQVLLLVLTAAIALLFLVHLRLSPDYRRGLSFLTHGVIESNLFHFPAGLPEDESYTRTFQMLAICFPATRAQRRLAAARRATEALEDLRRGFAGVTHGDTGHLAPHGRERKQSAAGATEEFDLSVGGDGGTLDDAAGFATLFSRITYAPRVRRAWRLDFCVPALDRVVFDTDVELAARFLRRYVDFTGAAPTPAMVAFAARLFGKGIVRFPDSTDIAFHLCLFLAFWGGRPAAGAAASELRAFLHTAPVRAVTIDRRFHAWSTLRYVNLRSGTASQRSSSLLRARRLHRDALAATADLWYMLSFDDIDRRAIVSRIDSLLHARARVTKLYRRLVREYPTSAEVLLAYALYCGDVGANASVAAVVGGALTRAADEAAAGATVIDPSADHVRGGGTPDKAGDRRAAQRPLRASRELAQRALQVHVEGALLSDELPTVAPTGADAQQQAGGDSHMSSTVAGAPVAPIADHQQYHISRRLRRSLLVGGVVTVAVTAGALFGIGATVLRASDGLAQVHALGRARAVAAELGASSLRLAHLRAWNATGVAPPSRFAPLLTGVGANSEAAGLLLDPLDRVDAFPSEPVGTAETTTQSCSARNAAVATPENATHCRLTSVTVSDAQLVEGLLGTALQVRALGAAFGGMSQVLLEESFLPCTRAHAALVDAPMLPLAGISAGRATLAPTAQTWRVVSPLLTEVAHYIAADSDDGTNVPAVASSRRSVLNPDLGDAAAASQPASAAEAAGFVAVAYADGATVAHVTGTDAHAAVGATEPDANVARHALEHFAGGAVAAFVERSLQQSTTDLTFALRALAMGAVIASLFVALVLAAGLVAALQASRQSAVLKLQVVEFFLAMTRRTRSDFFHERRRRVAFFDNFVQLPPEARVRRVQARVACGTFSNSAIIPPSLMDASVVAQDSAAVLNGQRGSVAGDAALTTRPTPLARSAQLPEATTIGVELDPGACTMASRRASVLGLLLRHHGLYAYQTREAINAGRLGARLMHGVVAPLAVLGAVAVTLIVGSLWSGAAGVAATGSTAAAQDHFWESAVNLRDTIFDTMRVVQTAVMLNTTRLTVDWAGNATVATESYFAAHATVMSPGPYALPTLRAAVAAFRSAAVARGGASIARGPRTLGLIDGDVTSLADALGEALDTARWLNSNSSRRDELVSRFALASVEKIALVRRPRLHEPNRPFLSSNLSQMLHTTSFHELSVALAFADGINATAVALAAAVDDAYVHCEAQAASGDMATSTPRVAHVVAALSVLCAILVPCALALLVRYHVTRAWRLDPQRASDGRSGVTASSTDASVAAATAARTRSVDPSEGELRPFVYAVHVVLVTFAVATLALLAAAHQRWMLAAETRFDTTRSHYIARARVTSAIHGSRAEVMTLAGAGGRDVLQLLHIHDRSTAAVANLRRIVDAARSGCEGVRLDDTDVDPHRVLTCAASEVLVQRLVGFDRSGFVYDTIPHGSAEKAAWLDVGAASIVLNADLAPSRADLPNGDGAALVAELRQSYLIGCASSSEPFYLIQPQAARTRAPFQALDPQESYFASAERLRAARTTSAVSQSSVDILRQMRASSRRGVAQLEHLAPALAELRAMNRVVVGALYAAAWGLNTTRPDPQSALDLTTMTQMLRWNFSTEVSRLTTIARFCRADAPLFDALWVQRGRAPTADEMQEWDLCTDAPADGNSSDAAKCGLHRDGCFRWGYTDDATDVKQLNAAGLHRLAKGVLGSSRYASASLVASEGLTTVADAWSARRHAAAASFDAAADRFVQAAVVCSALATVAAVVVGGLVIFSLAATDLGRAAEAIEAADARAAAVVDEAAEALDNIARAQLAANLTRRGVTTGAEIEGFLAAAADDAVPRPVVPASPPPTSPPATGTPSAEGAVAATSAATPTALSSPAIIERVAKPGVSNTAPTLGARRDASAIGVGRAVIAQERRHLLPLLRHAIPMGVLFICVLAVFCAVAFSTAARISRAAEYAEHALQREHLVAAVMRQTAEVLVSQDALPHVRAQLARLHTQLRTAAHEFYFLPDSPLGASAANGEAFSETFAAAAATATSGAGNVPMSSRSAAAFRRQLCSVVSPAFCNASTSSADWTAASAIGAVRSSVGTAVAAAAGVDVESASLAHGIAYALDVVFTNLVADLAHTAETAAEIELLLTKLSLIAPRLLEALRRANDATCAADRAALRRLGNALLALAAAAVPLLLAGIALSFPLVRHLSFEERGLAILLRLLPPDAQEEARMVCAEAAADAGVGDIVAPSTPGLGFGLSRARRPVSETQSLFAFLRASHRSTVKAGSSAAAGSAGSRWGNMYQSVQAVARRVASNLRRVLRASGAGLADAVSRVALGRAAVVPAGFADMVHDSADAGAGTRQQAIPDAAEEARLDSIVSEMGQIPVVAIDSRGDIIRFSRSAEVVFGYNAADILGRPVTLLMPDEIAVHHPLYISNYLRTRRTTVVNRTSRFKAVRANGEVFPIELNVRTLHVGPELVFVAYIRDMAQHLMREFQDVVNRELLSMTNTATVVIDAYGSVQRVNEATSAMFGYSAAELLGRNVKMIMPEEFSRVHDAHLERYRRTRVKHVIDTTRPARGRRKNGDTFPLELSVKEVLGMHTGDPNMFVGYMFETTHEAKLEQQGRLHGTVSAASPLPVITIDHRGAIIKFSRAASALFQYEWQEVALDAASIDLLVPPKLGPCNAFWHAYLASKDKADVEGARRCLAQRRDGSIVPVLATFRCVEQEHLPPQFVACVEDLSDIIAAERARRVTAVITRHSRAAYISITPLGIVTAFNGAAESIFEYEAGEVVGRNIKMLMPPAAALMHDSFLLRYRRDGEKRALDRSLRLLARRKSGQYFPMQIFVKEVTATSFSEATYVAFAEDCTEDVRANQNLGCVEEFLRMPTLCALCVDSSGVILSMSAGAENVFRVSARAMITRPLSDLFSEQDAAVVSRSFATFRETGQHPLAGRRDFVVSAALRAGSIAGGLATAAVSPSKPQLIAASSSTLFSGTAQRGRGRTAPRSPEELFAAALGGGELARVPLAADILLPLNMRMQDVPGLPPEHTAAIEIPVTKHDSATFLVVFTLPEAASSDVNPKSNASREPSQHPPSSSPSAMVTCCSEHHTALAAAAASLGVLDAIAVATPHPLLLVNAEGYVLYANAATERDLGYLVRSTLRPEDRGTAEPDLHISALFTEGDLAQFFDVTRRTMRLTGPHGPNTSLSASAAVDDHYGTTPRVLLLDPDAPHLDGNVCRYSVSTRRRDGSAPIRNDALIAPVRSDMSNMARTFVLLLRPVSACNLHDEFASNVASFADVAGTPTIVSDVVGTILAFSPLALRMFGYAHITDVIGQNVKILMTEDIAAQHDEALRRFQFTGVKTAVDATTRHTAVRADGRMITVEMIVRAVDPSSTATTATADDAEATAVGGVGQDLRGAFSAPPRWLGARGGTSGPSIAHGVTRETLFVAVLREVTDGRAAARGESTLELLLAHSPDPVIVANATGTILRASASAHAEFGYTEASDTGAALLIGNNVKVLMPPEVARFHDGYLKAYERTGVKTMIGNRTEVTARRRDGSTFPAELFVRELPALRSATNVTARVRTQSAGPGTFSTRPPLGEGVLFVAQIRNLQQQRALEAVQEQNAAAIDALEVAVIGLDSGCRAVAASRAALTQLGAASVDALNHVAGQDGLVTAEAPPPRASDGAHYFGASIRLVGGEEVALTAPLFPEALALPSGFEPSAAALKPTPEAFRLLLQEFCRSRHAVSAALRTDNKDGATPVTYDEAAGGTEEQEENFGCACLSGTVIIQPAPAPPHKHRGPSVHRHHHRNDEQPFFARLFILPIPFAKTVDDFLVSASGEVLARSDLNSDPVRPPIESAVPPPSSSPRAESDIGDSGEDDVSSAPKPAPARSVSIALTHAAVATDPGAGKAEVRFIVAFQNITDLLRVAHAQRLHDAVVEASDSAILYVDDTPASAVTGANAAARVLLNAASVNELIGVPTATLIDPRVDVKALADVPLDPVRDALLQSLPAFPHGAPTGGYHTAHGRITPLRVGSRAPDALGPLYQVVGTFDDADSRIAWVMWIECALPQPTATVELVPAAPLLAERPSRPSAQSLPLPLQPSPQAVATRRCLVAVDCTAQVQQHQILAASSTLFRHAPAALVLLDVSGRVAAGNAAASFAILGRIDPASVAGIQLTSMLRPFDPSGLRDDGALSCADVNSCRVCCAVLCRPNGSASFYEFRSVALSGPVDVNDICGPAATFDPRPLDPAVLAAIQVLYPSPHLATDASLGLELREPMPVSGLLPALALQSPLPPTGGAAAAAVCSFRDITGQVEAAIRAALRRTSAVRDPDALCFLDADGVILDHNGSFAAAVRDGRPQLSPLNGVPVARFIRPSDEARTPTSSVAAFAVSQSRWRALLADARSCAPERASVPAAVSTLDGRDLPGELDVWASTPAVAPVAFVCRFTVAADIAAIAGAQVTSPLLSPRADGAATMRDLALQLPRTLFALLPLGIILLDDAGRILMLNEAAQTLFDFTPRQAGGRDVPILFSDAASSGVAALMDAAVGAAVREDAAAATFASTPTTVARGVARADLEGETRSGQRFMISVTAVNLTKVLTLAAIRDVATQANSTINDADAALSQRDQELLLFALERAPTTARVWGPRVGVDVFTDASHGPLSDVSTAETAQPGATTSGDESAVAGRRAAHQHADPAAITFQGNGETAQEVPAVRYIWFCKQK